MGEGPSAEVQSRKSSQEVLFIFNRKTMPPPPPPPHTSPETDLPSLPLGIVSFNCHVYTFMESNINNIIIQKLTEKG